MNITETCCKLSIVKTSKDPILPCYTSERIDNCRDAVFQWIQSAHYNSLKVKSPTKLQSCSKINGNSESDSKIWMDKNTHANISDWCLLILFNVHNEKYVLRRLLTILRFKKIFMSKGKHIKDCLANGIEGTVNSDLYLSCQISCLMYVGMNPRHHQV